MIIQVQVGSQNVAFRLDWQHSRWHSLEELAESDFPLITVVDDKRYELYSDGTFAEVEK
jgi:hypothetical protein